MSSALRRRSTTGIDGWQDPVGQSPVSVRAVLPAGDHGLGGKVQLRHAACAGVRAGRPGLLREVCAVGEGRLRSNDCEKHGRSGPHPDSPPGPPCRLPGALGPSKGASPPGCGSCSARHGRCPPSPCSGASRDAIACRFLPLAVLFGIDPARRIISPIIHQRSILSKSRRLSGGDRPLPPFEMFLSALFHTINYYSKT